jgi:V/A-type H+-transporting ATPase subunit E
MSIEKIFERISSEADSAVEEILAGAREEAEKIKAEYASSAGQLAAKLGSYAERKGQEEEKHLIVSEQLLLRKKMLSEKRRILEKVYEDARQRIEKLPDEKYREIIAGMILARAVSGKEEIIVASGRQAGLDEGFVKSLNKEFKGGGSFTLAGEPGDFSWGVVLREGKRVVDLSLDVVFEQLKEKIEPKIAGLLFPQE